jgi:hypothetical protein
LRHNLRPLHQLDLWSPLVPWGLSVPCRRLVLFHLWVQLDLFRLLFLLPQSRRLAQSRRLVLSDQLPLSLRPRHQLLPPGPLLLWDLEPSKPRQSRRWHLAVLWVRSALLSLVRPWRRPVQLRLLGRWVR